MRQNLVFSVNFSITGKEKENYSELCYGHMKGRGNKNSRIQVRGNATMRKCVTGVVRTGNQPVFPKADEHVTSTGFYKTLPFFMIHHDSCTLSSHSIKIWSPVFLPFRLKYLAGSWCSTFNWVGREMAFWTSPWSLEKYSREQCECRDAITPVSFWRYPVFSHGDLPTDNHSAEQDAEERLPTPGPEHNLTVLFLLNMGCNPLLLS